MAIVVRRDLRNKDGLKVKSSKLMAQTGHASMLWLNKRLQNIPRLSEGVFLDLSLAEHQWLTGDAYTKVILGVDYKDELIQLVDRAKELYITAELVTDLGLTEFSEPTITCAAIGPDTTARVNIITGHLRPL